MRGREAVSVVVIGGGVGGLATGAGPEPGRATPSPSSSATSCPTCSDPEAAFASRAARCPAGPPDPRLPRPLPARRSATGSPTSTGARSTRRASPTLAQRPLRGPAARRRGPRGAVVRRTTVEWVLRRAMLAQPGVDAAHRRRRHGPRGRGPGRARAPPRSSRASGSTTARCIGRRRGRRRHRSPGRRAGLARRRRASRCPRPSTRAASCTSAAGTGCPPASASRPSRKLARRPRLREVPRHPRRRRHVLGHHRRAGRRPRAAQPPARDPDRLRRRLPAPARGRRSSSSRARRAGHRRAADGRPHQPASAASCDTDGAPRVLGLHAVGDAHTCTNPLYGRGCSLAVVQAVALADAFAEHPDDPVARAVAYEATVGPRGRAVVPHLGPDGRHGRRPERHRHPRGRAPTRSPQRWPRRPSPRCSPPARTTPCSARGLMRLMNLLATPADLMADPEFTGPGHGRHGRPRAATRTPPLDGPDPRRAAGPRSGPLAA